VTNNSSTRNIVEILRNVVDLQKTGAKNTSPKHDKNHMFWRSIFSCGSLSIDMQYH